MAWTDLKATVAAVVKTNGTQAITGALLQSTLSSIIDQVGANATFKGVATPTTTPGTPDGPVFYIAYEKGIYANFNAINITEEDGLVIILYSSNWDKINIPLASKDEQIQGGVYDVSSHNDGAVFESLSTMLGSANLSTLIPTSVRRGGMSIRFIQGSVSNPDNKYMQYFLAKNEWSASEADWQKMNLEEEVSQLGQQIGQTNIEIIEGETYSSDNGNIVSISTSQRTNKILFCEDALCNVFNVALNARILFWKDNIYLGYSDTTWKEITNWVSQDHSLTPNKIAFCWGDIRHAENLYYSIIRPINTKGVIDACDFSFSPYNSMEQNTQVLQSLLNGGSIKVLITKPGVYKLSGTILIYSNTEIECSPGVIFRKAAAYTNMFRNVGAETREPNSNITLRGFHLDIQNTADIPTDSALYGLRGEIAFLNVSNVRVYNYYVDNLMGFHYGILFNMARNFVVENAIIKGEKDAIHISSSGIFTIKNCIISTWDDAIALNASDWISSNCVNGSISNGLIENITDELRPDTSGYFCRLLGGSYTDWHIGISIKRGDTIVHNGRMYRAIVNDNTGTEHFSMTEPTISTFAGKQYDEGGFWWKLMRDDTTFYTASVTDIKFTNIYKESDRAAFVEETYSDGRWDRSIHPEALISQYPVFDFTVYNSLIKIRSPFTHTDKANTIARFVGIRGLVKPFVIGSPSSSALKHFLSLCNCDLRGISGYGYVVKCDMYSEVVISADTICNTPIETSGDGKFVIADNLIE